MSLTNKEIRRALKKMRIRSGDVVIVRKDSSLGTNEAIRQMAEIIEQTNLKDILIINVDDMDDIKSLPEQEMFKHGWIRRDKVRSLVLRKVTPTEQEVEDAVQD